MNSARLLILRQLFVLVLSCRMLQGLFQLPKARLLLTSPRFLVSRSMSATSQTAPIWNRPIGPTTVIILAGATSVGKSSVAMELCRHIDGEIVISDSVQVYKHLDIGSNKPTTEDQRAVRHHMLDIAEPCTVVTTGDYCRRAASAITDIFGRGKVPVVVGGSTMWVQWLVQGIPDAPKASVEITERAESLLKPFEVQQLWDDGLEVLKQYDPVRAAKLFRNDWYRLRRYLEIALQLYNTASFTQDTSTDNAAADGSIVPKSPSPGGSPILHGIRKMNISDTAVDFRTLFITEDRENLYHTIDSRCVDMLYNGHITETADLLRNEILLPEYPVSKAIGYRQTIDYLARGADNTGNSLSSIKDAPAFLEYLKSFCTATRNYAKRQLNWYRKDSMFLFIGMHRRSVAKEVAYVRAAEEVWHWATVPRAQFTDAVKAQVQANDALSELRARKWVPREYVPDTLARRLALAYLLHKGEYKVPYSAQKASVATEGAGNGDTIDGAEGSDGTGEISKRERKRLERKKLKTAPFNLNADTTSMRPGAAVRPSMAASAAEPTTPEWVRIIQDESTGITPDGMKDYQQEWSAQAMDIRSSGESQSSTMKLFMSQVSGPENADLYGRLIAEADKCRAQLWNDKRDLLVRFLQASKDSGKGPTEDA